MKGRVLALAAVVSSIASATAAEPVRSSVEPRSVESRSTIFTLDRVYKSMFGPIDYARVTLSSEAIDPKAGRPKRPEVVWITGIRAEIVGEDDQAESPEYFCHSNLRLASSQPANRMRLFGRKKPNKLKMFTLVQGQTEIVFPPGFGMPVLSNDHFASQVMVMTPTQPEEPVHVGVRSRIDFVHQSQLSEPMMPLYVVSLILKAAVYTPETQLLSEQHHGTDGSCIEEEDHIETVAPVDISPTGRKSPTIFADPEGGKRTTIWYVPPGRHVYRHKLQSLERRIPVATRAHYISAHLHPYGESLELIDLTTGESVFKSMARNFPQRVALEDISHYSGAEGIAIDPSHEYELIAVYDNSTEENVDSMAAMYLYLHDTQLKLR